jgi:DNA-binding transcriptional regulator YhcF (GntR family)
MTPTIGLTVRTRMRRYTLYHFWDASGALLYIGRTVNPRSRWGEHSWVQPWWLEVASVTVEHFADHAALVAAETAAIKAEHPRHNVVHNRPKAAKVASHRSRSQTVRFVCKHSRPVGTCAPFEAAGAQLPAALTKYDDAAPPPATAPLDATYAETSRPRYISVASKIRDRIEAGEWAPGTRIPTLKTLAAEYGVNHNTVCRAIEILEGEGLAWSRHGSGITVRHRVPRRARAARVARNDDGYVFGPTRGRETWIRHGDAVNGPRALDDERIAALLGVVEGTEVPCRYRVTGPASEPPFEIATSWIHPRVAGIVADATRHAFGRRLAATPRSRRPRADQMDGDLPRPHPDRRAGEPPRGAKGAAGLADHARGNIRCRWAAARGDRVPHPLRPDDPGRTSGLSCSALAGLGPLRPAA